MTSQASGRSGIPALLGTPAASSLRSLTRWTARQGDGVDLELVCAEHPSPAWGDPARTVIRMPTCLGVAPAHEILELLTVGAAAVVLRRDGCAHGETANAALDGAARMLTEAGVDRLRLTPAAGSESYGETGGAAGAPAVGQPGEAPAAALTRTARLRRGGRAPRRRRERNREVLDAARMPVARRQVLGLGAGAARDLPDEHDSAPRRLSVVLATLLAGVRQVDVPSEIDLPSPAVRLTARGCTACGVCVRACPTDALAMRHVGTGPENAPMVTTLAQDPTACDGCGICIQMCPEDVLAGTGAWGWDAVLERVAAPLLAPVGTLATARCRKCHTRFPTTDAASLCPVCTYRRQNPFGSARPPGL